MAQLDESKLKFTVPPKLKTLSLLLIAAGAILTALQVVMPWHAPGHTGEAAHNTRLWYSLHLALLVTLPLGVGGLYFVAFNHVAGSAWAVTIRRLAESHIWYLPVSLVLMGVILIFGMDSVFHHWVGAPEDDVLINHKKGWLDVGFFQIRNLIIVVVWFLLGMVLYKRSVTQDQDGKFTHTKFLANFSAFTVVFFAISISISGFDLSMSLEPHWFSTMWGVYIFAGVVLTIFSSQIIWIWYLKKNGYYGDSINENHIHDMGKYIWGFSIFWAYVGISQFLLIWYAHIPEETIFYNTRMYNDDMTYNAWGFVSLGLIFIRFIIPFFLIIRRDSKRNLNLLAAASVIVIIGQIWDMYWVAYPTLDHGHFIMFSWYEVGPLLLMFGLYILVIANVLTKNSLVPTKDPRLEECLHWHQ